MFYNDFGTCGSSNHMFYNGLGTFDSTNHMFYNDLARVAPQTQCFIMVLAPLVPKNTCVVKVLACVSPQNRMFYIGLGTFGSPSRPAIPCYYLHANCIQFLYSGFYAWTPLKNYEEQDPPPKKNMKISALLTSPPRSLMKAKTTIEVIWAIVRFSTRIFF